MLCLIFHRVRIIRVHIGLSTEKSTSASPYIGWIGIIYDFLKIVVGEKHQHEELMFSGFLRDKTDEEKYCSLLLWIGEKDRDVYHSWTHSVKKLKTYYDKFATYVRPKANTIFSLQVSSEKAGRRVLTDLRLMLKLKDCVLCKRVRENTLAWMTSSKGTDMC